MKIFEYRPFLGSLSIGLEHFPQNEVVEVANLPKTAAFSYNNTHKQWFLPNFSQIKDYETEKDYDLAILNPNLGEKIARQGKNNFKINDLCDCLGFLRRETPKFAIIIVKNEAIPFLNYADRYVRDGFGQLSKDIVVSELQKMGYDAYLIALDEADYGVPVHKRLGIYIATPNDFGLRFPKAQYSRYGRGNDRKYRTIADAIGDLGALSEWSAYSSDAQNIYQRYIRRGMPKVTWHFSKRRVSDKQKAVIRAVKPGKNANKTPSVKQTQGYVRPLWDRVCPGLDEKFYSVSSKYPSVHPIHNRTFTIREGMRIMGLPDNISFDLSVRNADVAAMIANSISPIIGEAIGIALRAIS